MSTYVGGLRARLIRDSMYLMLHDALAALGWFDAGRDHNPVTVIPEMLPFAEPIEVNTIAVAPGNEDDTEAEMGSNLSENRLIYYIDVYAESEALGTHLAGDVRDIVRGKMPSIGRRSPTLEVLDLTQAAPTTIFTCDIEAVTVDRAPNFTHPWQRYWWVLRFELVDTYGDEDDV